MEFVINCRKHFANNIEKSMACEMENLSARKSQCGLASIELAVMLPLLILMIDFVIEIGIVMHNQSVLSSSTSLAARSGIAATEPKKTTSEIAMIASNYCNQNLISIATDAQPLILVSQANSPYFQKPLRVSASYTFQGLLTTGFLSVMNTNVQMESTTVMYNE